MAVTFQSKSSTPITLLDDDAQKLLKVIGHSSSVPSALRVEDIQAALKKIEQAVVRDANLSHQQQQNSDDEKPVYLKNRMIPIVNLFNAALRDNEIVMWR